MIHKNPKSIIKNADKYDTIIIGSGLASLSSACYLAKSGKKVLVIEKNEQLGGRLSVFRDQGFVFDMGPSWIWMKDVFEAFFKDFGEFFEDLNPVALNPQFRMFFGDRFDKSKSSQSLGEADQKEKVYDKDSPIADYLDLPDGAQDIFEVFQRLEEGGRKKLETFLKHSNYTYKKGVLDYMQRRSENFWEFLNPEFLFGVLKAGLLKNYAGEIGRQFENPKIQEILNFPVLFLGATPEKTPYLYSLMADTMICGGTHYINGGMNLLIDKIIKIADGLGVDFLLSHTLKQIECDTEGVEKDQPKSITLEFCEDVFYSSVQNSSNQNKNQDYDINQDRSSSSNHDFIKNQTSAEQLSESKEKTSFKIPIKSLILGLDYQHGEQLLPKKYRRYDLKYWQKRVMAPSCLLYYLGFDKKIPGLKHHNLFFDTDFKAHAKDIYTSPKLPSDPLFYVCCPSQTDTSVAPEGCENLFVLIPIAAGLDVTKKDQESYLNQVFERIENNLKLGFKLKDRVVIKHFFGPEEFSSRYNSWEGNAYGLANTLGQTAIFKPKMRSKLKKTYFAGQLTIPGPGMPPCLISGKIAAEMLLEDIDN